MSRIFACTLAPALALLALAHGARAEATTSATAAHAHHHAHADGTVAAAAHVHDPYADVLGGHHHGAPAVSVSVGAVAASYDSHLYSGDYEGAMVAAGASLGRFALAVSLYTYQLDRNGARKTGLGDAMVHGHVALAHRGPWSAGLGVMGTAPTGSASAGLGMGHPMVMGHGWVSWRAGRLMASGSFGYGRSLGGATAHAEHGGAWPLVGPMNAAELTSTVEATMAIRPWVALGLSSAGAVPVGDGAVRVAGGVRTLWRVHALLATVDLQRGLVGDPFGTRVMASTTFRLE